MLSYRKLAMRVLGRPLHTGGGIDSPRPASQRAAAFALTAAMLITLAAPAFAGTWYIENGDITVKASGTEGKNTVSQGANQEVEDTNTIITNREDTASSHTVTINAEDHKVEVTLDNVNIKAKTDSGSALTSKGDVTLTLKGDNHLTGGNGSGGSGIDSSGSLTITGGENDSLTAKGGSGRSGISGSGRQNGGDGIHSGSLTISGGTVNATGGKGSNNNSTSGGSGISSSDGITIFGSTVNATGGNGENGNGGSGISGSGSLTVSDGGTVTATGGNGGTNTYRGSQNGGSGISSSSVTISGSTVNATGGDGNGGGGDGGSGITSNGGVTISDGTVNADGGSGKNGNGGDGIFSSSVTISGSTVNTTGGNGNGGNGGGNGIISFDHVAISGGTVNAAGGNGGNGSRSDVGNGIISSVIDLSGSLELTAKAGSPNGKALSRAGSELELDTIKDKLGPGAKVTVTDADGKVNQVSIPRPVEPEESSSSSDGGSSAPSAPASSLPGLTVTDKSGAVISYTSTRSGNTLTVCVGRFTASLRISLAALRQLRAEGIETITFQTILCSTTLSVDELLAMGGEDAEAVLTHRLTDSSLTVG